jgi:hypothetical protein
MSITQDPFENEQQLSGASLREEVSLGVYYTSQKAGAAAPVGRTCHFAAGMKSLGCLNKRWKNFGLFVNKGSLIRALETCINFQLLSYLLKSRKLLPLLPYSHNSQVNILFNYKFSLLVSEKL